MASLAGGTSSPCFESRRLCATRVESKKFVTHIPQFAFAFLAKRKQNMPSLTATSQPATSSLLRRLIMRHPWVAFFCPGIYSFYTSLG